jgi:hypothetical protein
MQGRKVAVAADRSLWSTIPRGTQQHQLVPVSKIRDRCSGSAAPTFRIPLAEEVKCRGSRPPRLPAYLSSHGVGHSIDDSISPLRLLCPDNAVKRKPWAISVGWRGLTRSTHLNSNPLNHTSPTTTHTFQFLRVWEEVSRASSTRLCTSLVRCQRRHSASTRWSTLIVSMIEDSEAVSLNMTPRDFVHQ